MSTTIDSVVQEIEGRLGELQQEIASLEAAKNALAGKTTTSAPATPRQAPKARTGRRGPGRPRGGMDRSAQALSIVQSQPGIGIPEIAQRMGIDSNYLYRVMPKLVEQGSVVRNAEGGWDPVQS